MLPSTHRQVFHPRRQDVAARALWTVSVGGRRKRETLLAIKKST